MITDDTKQQLAWDAASLIERLQAVQASEHGSRLKQVEATEPITDVPIVQDWLSNTHMEGVGEIKERLDRKNIPVETLRVVQNREIYPQDVDLPHWVSELPSLIQTITTTETAHSHTPHKESNDVVFKHFISTLVTHARARLSECNITTIPHTCVSDAHEQLYNDLTGIVTEVLFTEFQTFKALHAPTKIHAEPDTTDEISDSVYTNFIHKLHTTDGITELFTEYPVLPRLIVTRIEQWVEAIRELDTRLENDWTVLADSFDFNPSCDVTDVRVLASDRHKDGRRVVELTVDDGTKFVYKPRSVRTNELLDAVISHLANEIGIDYPTKKIVDNGTYGYVEHILWEGCSTKKEIEKFYKHIGCVLAASYVLEFTDCHYENLIAEGAVPRIVDTETIFSPIINTQSVTQAYTDTAPQLDAGVLKTGLLPQQYTSPVIPPEARLSGLSIPKAPVTGKQIEHSWNYPNTDYMALEGTRKDELRNPPPDNLPQLAGEVHPPGEYKSTIWNAFYNSLSTVTNTDSPTEHFTPNEPVSIRVILRQTREYARVLTEFSSPNTLQSGIRLTYAINGLLPHKSDRHSDDAGAAWSVFENERKQLLQLDVPAFRTTTHDTTVRGVTSTNADREEMNIITTPGVERATDTIQSLTEDRIRRQMQLIRISLGGATHLTPKKDKQQPQSPNSGVEPSALRREEATAIAEQIFADVMDASARTDSKNPPTWLVKRVDDTDRLTVTESSNGLYDGRGGIGVFAAAVASITDNSRAKRVATRIGNELTDHSAAHTESNRQYNFSNGVFGEAYALFTIGRLLDSNEFIAASKDKVLSVPETDLREWDAVDLMTGVTGAILVTTAINGRVQSNDLCSLIELLGDVLLDSQQTETEHNAWISDGLGQPVTGVSHGMTGVGYALHRAYTQTSCERFATGRDCAFAFEQDHYDSEAVNWRDVRPHSETTPDAWSYGRSGIASVSTHVDAHLTPVPEGSSLQTIVDETSFPTPISGDGMCSGLTGRAQLQTHLHQTSELTIDMETVRRELQGMVTSYEERGWFELEYHSDVLYNASLFQGTSGVGYSLLHTFYPERLPTVLLVE